MEEREKRKRVVVIQKYTLRELTEIYCTTKYLLLNDIKKFQKLIGDRKGNLYDPGQVESIFSLIRLPSNVEILK